MRKIWILGLVLVFVQVVRGHGYRERRSSQARLYHMDEYWNSEVVGAVDKEPLPLVHVAILDSGLEAGHAHFHGDRVTRVDWTKVVDDEEDRGTDSIGHGTFCAGVIAGSSPRCPGFCPASSGLVALSAHKVFDNEQNSFTSWFLDAINDALDGGGDGEGSVDVIALSVGGPDSDDLAFAAKVREAVANGALVVSAVGNEGPGWGTVTNPADMLEVLAVGGLDGSGEAVAAFSSRGASLQEFCRPGGRGGTGDGDGDGDAEDDPFGAGACRGYGIFKPDLLAPADDILSSALGGGCTRLSGTSVAAPVVAGTTAAMVAAERARRLREGISNLSSGINSASMRQALVSTARLLPRGDSVPSAFAQGAGRLDPRAAATAFRGFSREPRATLHPPLLDFAGRRRYESLFGIGEEEDDGADAADDATISYFSPLSLQPVFPGMVSPLVANVTLLSAAGVAVRVDVGPHWVQKRAFVRGRHDGGAEVERPPRLRVHCEASSVLWPYAGWLAVEISVEERKAEAQGEQQKHRHRHQQQHQHQQRRQQEQRRHASTSPSPIWVVEGEVALTLSSGQTLQLPVSVTALARAPPPERRLVWDMASQRRYPDDGFVPFDVLRSAPRNPRTTFAQQQQQQQQQRPLPLEEALADVFSSVDGDSAQGTARKRTRRRPSGAFHHTGAELLETRGDSLHTNFLPLFSRLRARGFFLEMARVWDLGGGKRELSKADNGSALYRALASGAIGAVLVFDPEDISPSATNELLLDLLRRRRTSLVLFSGWYNEEVADASSFFDRATRRRWLPSSHGSDIPGCNALLAPLGVRWHERATLSAHGSLLLLDGDGSAGEGKEGGGGIEVVTGGVPRLSSRVQSANPIAAFPSGGLVSRAHNALENQALGYGNGEEGDTSQGEVLLGFLDAAARLDPPSASSSPSSSSRSGFGYLSLFADASCADTASVDLRAAAELQAEHEGAREGGGGGGVVAKALSSLLCLDLVEAAVTYATAGEPGLSLLSKSKSKSRSGSDQTSSSPSLPFALHRLSADYTRGGLQPRNQATN